MLRLFWWRTFSLLSGLVATICVPQRDGIVDSIGGWEGMIYRAIRWEPICGTYIGLPPYQDALQHCTAAIMSYRNITDNAIAYFDTSGVRYLNAGIGLGRALCACFSLSNGEGTNPVDICWYFNEIGQYTPYFGWNQPVGSYRPGAAKSLKKCNEVDVPALQSQWSQTAIMPAFTGPVQTLQLGPSTVVQTVVQTQTYVLTPTLVPVTITSSSVITGSNGQVTTRDVSYVTTAAILNSGPSNGGGANDSLQRVKVGVGLGLGLPALAGLLWYAMYIYNKRNLPPPPATAGGGGGGGATQPILPGPGVNNPLANPLANGRGPPRY
ncbi:hypothetical protein FRC14_000836 [Serendipita sp. 396]|nr:hypothetical protein FRC14_000836 [Serendipita sp. 396]